jgi:glycerophosphoryl diester phosphodiesterase
MPVWTTLDAQPPRIIAHRGASGLRPEHTLEGYRLAIESGCDVIEPDLVASRDGVLLARHERELSRSTDVRSRAEWSTRANADSPPPQHWYTDEHDYQSLSLLRAIQPFPRRSKAYDGQFAIPTFDQVIALAAERWQHGLPLAIYPELKDPALLLQRGIDIAALLIAALQRHGLTAAQQLPGQSDRCWVQCFELEPLQRVHTACGLPVFALHDALSVAALRQLSVSAPWLSGVALSKAALIGATAVPGLVELAHQLGWQVHVWTLRDDAVLGGFANVDAEYAELFALGVDALFCDFPDSALRARQRWTCSPETPA